LDDDLSSRYSQLIRVLRWAVKLGRIDIYYEVSVVSQHLALPRVGHLEAVYHIFAYLMKHDKSQIIFDPADPIIDNQQFPEADWTVFYGDIGRRVTAADARAVGKSGKYICVCYC
jgi:hypothetical protein